MTESMTESSMLTAETSAIPAHGICTREARDFMRIRGNAHHAWVETWPSRWPETAWVPAIVQASVHVGQAGEVTVTADPTIISPESRATMEGEYRRALRDAGIVVPEKGRRYLTRHYAALDRAEAERLAGVDGTAVGEIKMAEADILHASGDWIFWSDGCFTTSIGVPAWAKTVRSLSEGAELLRARPHRGDAAGRSPPGGRRRSRRDV